MLLMKKLLIFIPVIAIVMITSCSGSKKLTGSLTVNSDPGKNLSQSQEDDEVPVQIFENAEIKPKFPGGKKALKEFINSNIQYPQSAKDQNIQGRVFLKFCVRYDGSIAMVKVLRGLSPEIDEEALRIIRMLPRWQPGRQNGKFVNAWYTTHVPFYIDLPGTN
jgi:TonB family protein